MYVTQLTGPTSLFGGLAVSDLNPPLPSSAHAVPCSPARTPHTWSLARRPPKSAGPFPLLCRGLAMRDSSTPGRTGSLTDYPPLWLTARARTRLGKSELWRRRTLGPPQSCGSNNRTGHAALRNCHGPHDQRENWNGSPGHDHSGRSFRPTVREFTRSCPQGRSEGDALGQTA